MLLTLLFLFLGWFCGGCAGILGFIGWIEWRWDNWLKFCGWDDLEARAVVGRCWLAGSLLGTAFSSLILGFHG